jgi:hypothetical protein
MMILELLIGEDAHVTCLQAISSNDEDIEKQKKDNIKE